MTPPLPHACPDCSILRERIARIETRAENLAQEVDDMSEKQDKILEKLDEMKTQINWYVAGGTALAGAVLFLVENWDKISGVIK